MHCPLRTRPHSGCSRSSRCAAASCARRVSHASSKHHRTLTVAVKAAAKTLYEALGVSQDATDRDIKRAYRQKALKLHPDVNKAPNAQEQFLEVKNAFQVLSDPRERAQYDRKLTGGFGDFGSWGGYGSWGGSSSSSSSKPRPKQQEEEFYGLGDLLNEVGSAVGGWVQQAQQELGQLQQGVGTVVQQAGDALKAGKFEDFFKDLDKELDAWSKQRAKDGKPASLWEELAAIGEEFVDFLEQGLKDEQRSGAGKEGSSSGSSSSFNNGGSTRARSPVDKFEELKRQYDMYDDANSSKARGSSSSSSSSSNSSSTTGGASSTSSSSSQTANRPAPKTADEEIDDMLAALKKKMNKQ